MKYAFVEKHRDQFSVRVMCHCLGVHPSGFYAWLNMPLSNRAKEDIRQTELIKKAWKESDKVYGYRKIHDDLMDQGETFVIDPEGVLRAMLYYPMSNGRSVPEILRLVTALQASDAQKIATPEGWTPGQDAIVPPPKTAEAARQRGSEGYATTDWYFSTRKVA